MNKDKTMTNKELMIFIDKIGRCELFYERDLQEKIPNIGEPYCLGSIYYKGVAASLEALGYDREWIDTKFKPAFYDKYY